MHRFFYKGKANNSSYAKVFSIYTNHASLFESNYERKEDLRQQESEIVSNPKTIDCIHGIRTLSILFIIIGHILDSHMYNCKCSVINFYF